jgi:hypothetical protein
MSTQSAFLTMFLDKAAKLTLRELKRGATDMPGARSQVLHGPDLIFGAMFNDNCSLANSWRKAAGAASRSDTGFPAAAWCSCS